MKKLLNKMKYPILYGDIVIAILFVMYHFVLAIFHMRFRQWIYYLVPFLLFFGFLVGVIQLVRKKSQIVKRIALGIGITGMILTVIFWKIPFLLLAFTYYPEHVVEKEGKKYIAYVKSFLDVDVYYYDYINLFFAGNQVKIHEWYGNGGYDPFDGEHDNKPIQYDYYDDNGKLIDTNDPYANLLDPNKTDQTNEIPNLEKTNEIEENAILYQKIVNDKIAIRVVYKGAVLAQRSIIGIEKTVDGGKTWTEQMDNPDRWIQIHNGAEFVFLDENIGFIKDPGLAGTSGENQSLMVTIDGGKSFTNSSEIVSDKIEKEIFIEGVPYIENGILKLNVYTLDSISLEKTYYKFYSEDNGFNWKYE